jgi:hypothetical protein
MRTLLLVVLALTASACGLDIFDPSGGTGECEDRTPGAPATAAAQVFVVGAGGDCGPEALLVWDGSTWTGTASEHGFTQAWGASPTDVFAVGTAIVRYDGGGWSEMEWPGRPGDGRDPWLLDVWGSSGSDVFAVGEQGTILHYDGAEWAAMDPGVDGSLYAVWGTSGTDVHVVGEVCSGTGCRGVVLHYDGAGWAEVGPDTNASLRGVWTGGGQVFVVGVSQVANGIYDAEVLYHDGAEWSHTQFPGAFLHTWGSGVDDVMAVGTAVYGWDGADWSRLIRLQAGLDLTGVWGASGSDVFVTGTAGVIHFDGTTWAELAPRWQSGYGRHHGVWGF